MNKRCINTVTTLFTRPLAFLLVVLLMAGTTCVHAIEDEPANYVFASYLGNGLYNGTDNSVFVLNIPLSYEIPGHSDYRLRITTSLGFYEYGRDQIDDLQLPDDVGTIAVIPGIEKVFNITDQWELTPYLDIGWAKNLSTHESARVFSTGVQSRYSMASKYADHVWVNKLIYVGYETEDSHVKDSYVKLLTGYDFKVGAYIPFMGRKLVPTVYGSLFWSYNGLDYYQRWKNNFENDLVFEIGASLFTKEPIDLWVSDFQRIGIGYQHNPIGGVIRLFLGTPF